MKTKIKNLIRLIYVNSPLLIIPICLISIIVFHVHLWNLKKLPIIEFDETFFIIFGTLVIFQIVRSFKIKMLEKFDELERENRYTFSRLLSEIKSELEYTRNLLKK